MNKKILVIDDEKDVVKVLKQRLKNEHFDVMTAGDGDEGLAKLQAEKPNLIVLDIMMPMMDGYTFVRQMQSKDETKHIPIIILTAKEGLQDLFQLEGIQDYLTKPYEFKDLLGKVKKYLP